MPVKRVGKNVVEVGSGKIVQRCRSERNAAIAVAKRNKAHRKKHGGK